MDLIAKCGLKTDLHIHSALSAHKDGEKVKENTLANLNILVDKLIANQVNICAITDHDAFSFELYCALKDEEKKENCIKKILPGVEFSVSFDTGKERKVIHIVTIFDDSDEEKVKQIQKVLEFDKNRPKYDAKDAFTEDMYISILKEIGIDTVMIAHQKNSLLSNGNHKKNDVSSLGEEKFNEFLFFEYFEAFEFRNKKNEIFNKKFILENHKNESLRMITGSDCHQWRVYPKEDESSTGEFAFTFIKCLPCFRGLVMAVTDTRRIKLTNSFFNPTEYRLENIIYKIDGEEHTIPLSSGINVIIGDNSVGKSLLLHKINDNRKLNATPVKRGYEKYLKENHFELITKLNERDVFRFDTQGEVRKLFEEGQLKASEFLQQYFPEDILPKPLRSLVEAEFQRFYDAIQTKIDFDRCKKQLSPFKLVCEDNTSQSLTFIETLKSISDTEYQNISTLIAEVIDRLGQIDKLPKLETADINVIQEMKINLEGIRKKYEKKCQDIQLENKKINTVKILIRAQQKKYTKLISDEQKIISAYLTDIAETIEGIVNTVSMQNKIHDYKFELPERLVPPKKADVYQYTFISKLNIEEISSKYLEEVISKVIKKDKKINTRLITQDILQKIIQYYPEDAVTPLAVFKEKISTQLDKDFTIKHSIIQNGMDVYKELSDGLNAQIYFTLISGETTNRGIYIIDQPEDHVSPKAIKEYLLDQFKDMGEVRQVIMVTHNPQFIVNLDVDNVIFISNENKHSLKIVSGALEYENDNYSILKIIAENVEGGLSTVARRMKRYEKGVQF